MASPVHPAAPAGSSPDRVGRIDLRPSLALRLAVTGHRIDGRAPLDLEALGSGVDTALAAIVAPVAESVRATPYRDEPPSLTLLTGLAEGADQLAAEVALARGWRLHAVLPFAVSTYRGEFLRPDAAAGFEALLSRAAAVTTLDGPSGEFDAFEPLADVLVWNADLLLAVWDGRPARGAGGAATVIARARREMVPIVRIDPDHAGTPWLEDLSREDEGRGAGLTGLAVTVARLLAAPPIGPVGMQFLRADYPRRPASRLHDRLIGAVAATGRPAHPTLVGDPAIAVATRWRDAWGQLPAGLRESIIARFATAHSWADQAGLWYAAAFRQAYTAIFLLTVAAVLAAGVGAAESQRLAFVPEAVEVLLLATMLFFVRRERHSRSQDRWLQLRALAERLRHLAVLWPLGRTTPLVRVPAAVPGLDCAEDGLPGEEGWVAWYLRAVAREAGLVPGELDAAHVGIVREWILDTEVRPQREFHEGAVRRARAVHRPLERAAERLVVLAVGLAVVRLTGASGFVLVDLLGWSPLAVLRVERVLEPALHALAVALPALAGGIHGFLGMADFEGGMLRSGAIAPQLARHAARVRQLRPATLSRVGDVTADIVRVMEGELGVWQTGTGSRRLQA